KNNFYAAADEKTPLNERCFLLCFVVTFQPVPAFNQRETFYAVSVQVDPRTPIRRLDQFALIVLSVAFKLVELSQNRCINTIHLAMYRTFTGDRCRVMAQIINLIAFELMLA